MSSSPRKHLKRIARPRIQALEARMMFDGAAAADAIEVRATAVALPVDAVAHERAVAVDAPADRALAEQQAAAPARELVFIDSNIKDWQSLVGQVRAGAEVVVLQAGSDPWAQMTAAITQHQGLTAVHLISHGNEGQIIIGGNTYQSADGSLQARSELLSQWHGHMAEGADILVYGCDVAAGTDGRALVDTLARLTMEDVAASTDATGNGGGGNWVLEATAGTVSTEALALAGADWQGALATTVYDAANGTLNFDGSGSSSPTGGWYSISGSGNGTASGDVIRFNNVITIGGQKIDAVVTTTLQAGVTISEYDNASGKPSSVGEYFQPNLSVASANAGNGATFTIDFYKAGTYTGVGTGQAVTLQNVVVNSYDLDSVGGTSSDRQYQDFKGFARYELATTTYLVPTTQADGSVRFLYTSASPTNNGTVTADAYRVRVYYDSISSFQVKSGVAKVGTSAFTGTAYYALDFSLGPNFTGATNITGTPAAAITYSTTTLSEAGANDGSIGNTSTITLANGTFTGTNGQVLSGVTVSNVPAGLTAVVTRVDSTHATLSLTGNATVHANANDIGNLTVAFGDAAFTSANAGAVTGSTRADIVVDFADPAANAAPVATASGGSAVFTEGKDVNSTPVVVDSGLTLTDADNATLASASVGITGNFQSTEDTLAFTNSNASTFGNISASYNSGTGVLTLSSAGATATVAQWQAALRAVTYTNSSDAPNSSTRTVSFTVNDGTANSTAVTRSVTVTPVNDTPAVSTSGGSAAFTEGNNTASTPVVIDGGLTVSDVDNTTLASATVSVTGNFHSAEDVLAFTNNGSTMGNIAASYNSATGVMTLTSSGATATKAQWQAALRAVTYTNSADTPTTATRTISYAVNDGADTSTAATRSVTVAAVNDTPVATASGGSAAFTEGKDVASTPVLVDSGLTLSDADSTTLATAAVSLTGNFQSAEDLLAFTNNPATMGNIAASYSAGTGVLTLTSSGATATLAQWQAALRSVTYTNSSDAPNSAPRTVSFVVNDGASNSSTVTRNVTVTPVNDTPVVSTSGGSAAWTSGSPVAIDSGLSVSDVDNATLASATVSVTSNFQSGEDVLAFTNTNSSLYGNIVASYNGGTGVLSLSSSGAAATKAQWQAALRAVTFSDSAGSPSTATRTVSFSVNDGSDTSLVATRTVTVTAGAVNSAPVLTDTSLGLTVLEDAGLPVGAVGAALGTFTGGISDADSDALLGVAITATDETHGTWYWSDNGGSTWNAVGSVSSANALLLADAAGTRLYFAPAANDNGSAAAALTLQAWDQTSGTAGTKTAVSGTAFSVASDTVTVTVTPVNDAPAGADATVALNEDGSHTFVAADFGFTDATDGGSDSGASVLAAVKISTVPALGALTLNGVAVSAGDLVSAADIAAGKLVYTPAANGNGAGYASFNFQVQDDGGTANAGVNLDATPNTITFNVAAVNDAPVAGNGSNPDWNAGSGAYAVTTPEDTARSGQIEASDVDGNTLGYSTQTGPAHGSVTLNAATGAWTYTPAANYNGNDSFVVAVDDGHGGVTNVTVNVTVTPVNDVPTVGNPANPDWNAGSGAYAVATPEDTPRTGQIDTGDVDGNTLGYSTQTGPAHGAVSVNPTTGAWTYTPAANYNGNDSFVVAVDDGHGGVTNVTVNVTVTPVNDVPMVGNPTNPDWNAGSGAYAVATPEDTPRTGQIDTGDVDGNTLGYSTQTGPAHGAVSVNPTTGAWTYTPAANYNGNDSFVVAVDDGHGGVTNVTVNVTVTPVNDVPVWTDGALLTNQDSPWAGQLPAAQDSEGGSLVYALSQTAQHGSVTVSPDGRYVYTPAAGFHGTDRFQVQVLDAAGGATTAWVDVTVLPGPTIALPAASDLGVSNSDRVTTAPVITLDGQGVPGQTLRLYTPDGALLREVVVDAQGQWAAPGVDLLALTGDNATSPAGAAGNYTFTLRAVQPDGSAGAAMALTVVREVPKPAPAPEPVAPPPAPSVAPPPAPAAEPMRPEPAPFNSALQAGSVAEPLRDPRAVDVVQNDPASASVGNGRSDAIYTSDTGFRTMVVPAPQPTLRANNGVDDQTVRLGQSLNLQLPADTFVHTQVDETVTLHAAQANGKPLPGWLQFDGKTGTLSGEPPDDWRTDVTVKVVARDSKGREAVVFFKVKVGAAHASRGASLSQQLMQADARGAGLYGRATDTRTAAGAVRRA